MPAVGLGTPGASQIAKAGLAKATGQAKVFGLYGNDGGILGTSRRRDPVWTKERG